MYLKRQYDHSSGKPVVSGVKLLRANKRQHFSQSFIDGGMAEGWLSVGGGKITVTGTNGKAEYLIVARPAIYCCHCDEQIGALNEGATPEGAKKMRAHVDGAHKGIVSPDPNNPAGYRQDNFFACVKVGDGVENMTKAEAAEMDRNVRKALHEKLQAKYGAKKSPAKTAAKIASVGAALILGLLADHLLQTFLAVPGVMLAANFVYNIGLGRVVELYNRVDSNDPANSALIIALLASSGIESDATLKDKDDLAAVVSGTTNEATNTGYARKVLTDSDLSAFAPDDTNDRTDLDIPDQTWTGVANDGTGAIGDLLVCYDSDTTGGADSAIVPLTQHDFAVTPDGSDITAQIAAAGFFRAS